MYRQGDVLLVPVARVEGRKSPSKKRIVLAEGEVTGHAHSVSAKDAELFVSEVETYLRVRSETDVTHQEHSPITLPPGSYKVVRQREYSPEAIRNVSD